MRAGSVSERGDGFRAAEPRRVTASIIDGRALASELRADLLTRSAALRSRGVVPRLAVVVVGEDAASHAYVRSLVNIGEKTGIEVAVVALAALDGEDAVRARLLDLGADPAVHGIILQQPLPKSLSIRRIADAVDARKDVDGANPLNQGRLAFATGAEFVPATPMAVMLLLERTAAWPLRSRHAVMVGRSNVVGLPVSLLMMAEDATVTVTHEKTIDLGAYTRQGEVVVVATGVPGLITGDMLKPGAVVIDVGTTYVDGKLRGDVDWESASQVASAITPVPGGVGPVTNVALMRNVMHAAESLSATP